MDSRGRGQVLAPGVRFVQAEAAGAEAGEVGSASYSAPAPAPVPVPVPEGGEAELRGAVEAAHVRIAQLKLELELKRGEEQRRVK